MSDPESTRAAPLILALPGNETLATRVAELLGGELGEACLRHFPDGETYVRLETDPSGREVALVADLHRPDEKSIPMLLVAETARDLGAKQVGLIAPYLPYMRQDKRFQAGEGVTSRYFARLISRSLGWLVTVDPHLHRYSSLSEVYSIPTRVVHAAPAIAAWIQEEVEAPVLVGPDSESEQWVSDVARRAGAPFFILEKVRRGDRDVEVSRPDLEPWRDRTPVLVDDIISTARTMIETLRQLEAGGMPPAVCVAVHALFSGDAWTALRSAGPAKVVTCATVLHPSNAIEMAKPLATAARELLGLNA